MGCLLTSHSFPTIWSQTQPTLWTFKSLCYVLGRTTKIFRTRGWMDEMLMDDIYNCQNGCKDLARGNCCTQA